ncbi:hypothetical protein KM043_002417 [Ampulex compressa]|nr:hypothetical protein KM043_002417 [Ampulex compressa]
MGGTESKSIPQCRGPRGPLLLAHQTSQNSRQERPAVSAGKRLSGTPEVRIPRGARASFVGPGRREGGKGGEGKRPKKGPATPGLPKDGRWEGLGQSREEGDHLPRDLLGSVGVRTCWRDLGRERLPCGGSCVGKSGPCGEQVEEQVLWMAGIVTLRGCRGLDMRLLDLPWDRMEWFEGIVEDEKLERILELRAGGLPWDGLE